MDNVIKDFKGMGFLDVDDLQLYTKQTLTDTSWLSEYSHFSQRVLYLGEREENQTSLEQVVYPRKVTCPVCGNKFSKSAVRSKRVRFYGTDPDLRPVYRNMDPMIYEVTVCDKCSYAALDTDFNEVNMDHIPMVRRKISPVYKKRDYGFFLSYDEGIERHKLALYNAIAMNEANSKRAYLCLCISWLYRGWQELLMSQGNIPKQILDALSAYEYLYTQKAYIGFLTAYEYEKFPVVGMEKPQILYLQGVLAYRLGNLHICKLNLSKVIEMRSSSKRLQDKISDMREELAKVENENKDES